MWRTSTAPPESPVLIITLGMLIDFEVFEVEDILDLVNNTSALDERISEAE